MDLFETLRSAANSERAVGMSAYMRDQFAFLGIQSVERRRLSRPLLRLMDKKVVDWDFVGKCWRQPEREFQYIALDYLHHATKRLTADDIPRLKQLVQRFTTSYQ